MPRHGVIRRRRPRGVKVPKVRLRKAGVPRVRRPRIPRMPAVPGY